MPSKSAKRLQKAPAERPNGPNTPSAPKSSEGNPRLLWIATIGSIAILIVVYCVYPAGPTNSEEEPTSQGASQQSEATAVSQSADAELAAQSAASLTKVAPFALPVAPRTIDTATEQSALTTRVEKAVADFPLNPSAAHIAALTYAELLQTEKATTYFKKSLELNPREPQVLVDYASLLTKTGKQQEAVELLREPIAQPTATAAMYDTFGGALMETGELEQAASTLESAAAKFPNDSSIQLRLAQVQMQLQKFAEAEKAARAALALGRTDNAVYAVLSSALIRLGQRDEGLKVRAMATTENPQAETEDSKYRDTFQKFAAHTTSLLANVYRSNRQQESAEQLLRDALALDPDSTTSLLAMADLLYQQRRPAEAIPVYERLIKLQPENLYNYNNLASLAVSVGNVSLAESALRQASKVDPTGNATLRLADFLLRLGNASEASVQARAAVDQLANADAYLVFIAALKAEGKNTAAINALVTAREKFPNDARIQSIQL